MTTPLCLDNLSKFDDKISRPDYERQELSPGIVHIGVGNFHKAHQAVYLDKLFNTGMDKDWAIIGASVMESDARLQSISISQDHLTTVVEQSATNDQARITGAMVDYIKPGDYQAILSQLIDPAIRIVSLAITEGGYFIDSSSGQFDQNHPAIAHDRTNPDKPKTVFGLLLAALKTRRLHSVPAFTIMSCDNLPHNGVISRNAVVGLASLTDPDFADWVEKNVAFPNSMVDRITPATSDREIELTKSEYGIDDAAPVFCEDFTQWVLEDNFCCGRPALEKVGVQFVADVSNHEMTKIRMLNGGHALIAYPAGLLDIQFVHEAMQHPLINQYMTKVEQEEIIPVVPEVGDIDKQQYLEKLKVRFSNPKIADTIQRLCFDGSNRQPKFIIPTVADRLDSGAGIKGLSLASALWCRYCYGSTESGKPIAPNDPSWESLVETARRAKHQPDVWLSMHNVYGELGQSSQFKEEFATALKAIWQNGALAVLTEFVENRL